MSIPQLGAGALSLFDVFSSKYVFRIPLYQRPYSWNHEQATELLDDLKGAIDEIAKIGDLHPYFLGSIVLIKQPDDPTSDVVDGQQRLTTLTILMSVLRDLTVDPKTQNSRHEFICQDGNTDAGLEDVYRITLREEDAAFFRSSIQTPGTTGKLPNVAGRPEDPRVCLVENANVFRKELVSWSNEKRDRLVQFLLQRCYLVVVTTSDHKSAYRIFSVLNARGLDLSPTDILKATIVGAIPEKKRTKYITICDHFWSNLGNGMDTRNIRGTPSRIDWPPRIGMAIVSAYSRISLDEFHRGFGFGRARRNFSRLHVEL